MCPSSNTDGPSCTKASNAGYCPLYSNWAPEYCPFYCGLCPDGKTGRIRFGLLFNVVESFAD